MPDTKLQGFLDAYVASKGDLGGIVPKEPCTINRNPSGTAEPWAVITSSGVVSGGAIDVNYNAFTSNLGAVITKTEIFIDSSGSPLVISTTLPYTNNALSVGALAIGNHLLKVKVFDSLGNIGISTVTIKVNGITPSPTNTLTPTPTLIPTPIRKSVV